MSSFEFEDEPEGSKQKVVPLDPVFRNNVLLWFFKPSDLKRVFSEEQPDVILIDGGPANPQTLVACYMAKKVCPHAKILNFTWHNLPYKENSLKTFIARQIQKYTFPKLDMILAGPNEAIDIFKNEGFTNRIDYFPLVTVDNKKWKPCSDEAQKAIARKSLGVEGFAILFSGRIVFEKGVDLLIEALSLLAEDCHLYLLGGGSDEDEFSEMADKVGVRERVHFLGCKHPDELPDIYRLFDLFVLPSRTTKSWVEQFGMVLIEAMASGLPVLGSSSGSIPRVVDNPDLVFQEGNIDELSVMISNLYSDKAFFEQMVEHSRTRAAQFDCSAVANKFADLCSELIGE